MALQYRAWSEDESPALSPADVPPGVLDATEAFIAPVAPVAPLTFVGPDEPAEHPANRTVAITTMAKPPTTPLTRLDPVRPRNV
jgi:hypothetical protein